MKRFTEILNALHYGINPYLGFRYDQSDIDMHGWNSSHSIFQETIHRLRPRTIIEVGTWKGASARHMAAHCKSLGLDSVIICVDTWLAEEILWTSPEWFPSLKCVNGRPTVYNTFLANTLDSGLQDYIVPLSMPSLAAARYLKIRGVSADMIYIDGSHIENEVYDDLDAYFGLLREGGVLIGDDYVNNHPCNFEGLIRDVHRFGEKNGITPKIESEKYIFVKAMRNS